MRAHVPLGFDTTAPIACISRDLKNLREVIVYLAPSPHPKSEDALKSLETYLSAVGVKAEVVQVNPCSTTSIFEVALWMDKDNLICGGSGFRALGLLLVLACIFSKRRCFLRASLETGGPCLEVDVSELASLALNEVEALAISIAVTQGKVSPSDLEKYGFSKKSAWKHINDLVDKGLLVKQGRGKYAPGEGLTRKAL